MKINESGGGIHPTAIVDSSAEIDNSVSIGPYSIIGPDVKIAKNTSVGPHVVIGGSTSIGSGNRIFQFSSIGEIPQDKKFHGENSELIIGDDNTIREYVTINRGTEEDQGYTKIGDRNWIMAYVHIAHDCNVENDITFANGATLAGHVTVEEFAILGGFTLVHQFCRIGAYSFCAMGTALNRDLPPYLIASGNYASTHGLNKEGLHR
ncbi:MAG: acyl-ACP--UDP-N-acetylglucosamine O-acyltransferase, partial [Gammaproteobacteria bacterium]